MARPYQGNSLQAVGSVRGERCSTQAVLPLVGLAADKVIRHRYSKPYCCIKTA
ncbi:MAG: hypothetical protein ACQESR_15750 [Planctomycetota bacterium]